MSLKLIKRDPYFHLRGTVRGVTVRETTGCTEREDAEAVRIKREAEIVERSIFGRNASATFLEAAVMYLEAGGEARYVEPLTNHFGTTKLARIDQTASDNAARVLYDQAAPSTLNRQVYTPVGAILHFAAERKLCEWRTIRRPKQPKGRVRWLESDEANKLIEACSPHLKPLVIFLFYTGARLSEALYLDWRDVDLSRRQVSFTDTKNGESRGVPLHDRVLVAFANLPHREGAVFRRPASKVKPLGEPYKVKREGGGQIKTAFRGACRRAGITDFTPHDCRHTWATWHYAANRNLKALMELGGWKSEAMVMRYVHVNSDHLRDSIEALPSGAKSAQSERKAS
jgi:integrase